MTRLPPGLSSCYAPWGALELIASATSSRISVRPSGDSTSSWLSRLQEARFGFYPSRENGGAERDRTVDPLLAKQVLSQLSYSPIRN